MASSESSPPGLPALPSFPAGTNVVSVGIDIESVARVRTAVERHGDIFLKKVFTPEEISLCKSRGSAQWEAFAARWAAKEAFSKALGTGIGETFAMPDAGVVNNALGAPELLLSARARVALRERGAQRALLSITHTRDYAAAIVIFVC